MKQARQDESVQGTRDTVMEKNSGIKELLAQGCALLEVELDDNAVSLLARYFFELRKWNRKINLIGRAPDLDIVEKHFLDSLTLLPFLRQQPDKMLLDVGSGGGFPALVLKTCLPELQLCLAEPRLKRVAFLKHIIRTLGLRQTTVVAGRLAPDNPVFQGRHFPMISCRGLAAVGDFLELCRPFSSRGERVICMKGPRAGEELAAWQQKHQASPYHLEQRINCRLPFSKSKREILIFTKE